MTSFDEAEAANTYMQLQILGLFMYRQKNRGPRLEIKNPPFIENEGSF